MSDFQLVDPKGWEYDLQSVYSAYIGYFQVHNIAWYDRSWGHLFSSFEDFLSFSWPAVTVTDAWTGRAHIVTRLNSIGAFLKMIKTRQVQLAILWQRFCLIQAFIHSQIRGNVATGSEHPAGVSVRNCHSAFTPHLRLCHLQEDV